MEAAGFIALGSLFNDAVDWFRYVQLGRNCSRGSRTSVLQLDDARLRLSRWGQSVGLSGNLYDTEALRTVFESEDKV